MRLLRVVVLPGLAALLVACSSVGPAPSGTTTPSGPAVVVSPDVRADGAVTLRLRADDAVAVTASGDFGDLVLTKDPQGIWSGTTARLAPAVYAYSFTVDGVQRADPSNPDSNSASAFSLVTVPGDPPMAWEVQDVPHGQVTTVTLESDVLGRQRRLHVYTPPGYEDGTDPLPVLYLLHGYTDDDSTWTAVGKAHVIADNLAAQGVIEPMIIVMPYGQLDPSTTHDDALGPEFAETFETELLAEIIPAVEETYRVVPDARHRAIAGLSMGGLQSAVIGMNHPEVFSTVGMWSAAVFDSPSVVLARLAEAPDDVQESFRYVEVAVGEQDDLLRRSAAIDSFLTSQGIDHVYATTPGTHSWLLWRSYLVEFLPVFADIAS